MAGELRLSLTGPQAAFVTAEDRFPAIVAGFGSGKTEALVNRLLVRKIAYPGGWVGYYGPTFDLINLIAVPRFEGILEQHGFAFKLNKQEMVMKVRKLGAFVFRTMERPERIIGFETADAGVDELDTLKIAHAEHAWRKIIARNRQKKPNGERNTVAVATTPEGFRFTHRQWVKAKADGYKLFHASTYSNAHNLPEDYIPSLEASYPPQLLKAYLEGQFVNLTSGAIYPDFDRKLNHTPETIKADEPLHIGMDFNVYKMAAVVHVMRDGLPRALAELVNLRDTPAMIEAIKSRYGNAGRSITIYPDASGDNKSSKGASLSDIVMLKGAGFQVSVGHSNPAVKDRIASVNGMILNAKGERRYLVNTDACPITTECIEQQVYDETNGEPDKKSGFDHTNDGLGYFLHRRFPIVVNTLQRLQVVGA
ncbi:terminase family protein [Variovorax sp. J22R193]|uniref:terminase large subunit domain-containing protein n=1 Tax=Variovorax fucosicus TaxID=3053517 RepID=UPI00257875ED|nr:terminase family protein [Variovorax sp. J22R193]MDM0041868.1 terminase family protein [Variovorax sp. J22R193]